MNWFEQNGFKLSENNLYVKAMRVKRGEINGQAIYDQVSVKIELLGTGTISNTDGSSPLVINGYRINDQIDIWGDESDLNNLFK